MRCIQCSLVTIIITGHLTNVHKNKKFYFYYLQFLFKWPISPEIVQFRSVMGRKLYGIVEAGNKPQSGIKNKPNTTTT